MPLRQIFKKVKVCGKTLVDQGFQKSSGDSPFQMFNKLYVYMVSAREITHTHPQCRFDRSIAIMSATHKEMMTMSKLGERKKERKITWCVLCSAMQVFPSRLA